MMEYLEKTLLQHAIDKYGSYEAWQEAAKLERDRKARAMNTRQENKKKKQLAVIVEKQTRELEAVKAKLGIKDNPPLTPQRKPRSLVGYVYLVKSVTGLYKIGRTVNPHNRLLTFNVKLPFEVSFECVIQTDDMYALEADLHARFANKRVNGEWFNLSSDDVEQIKSENI